MARDAAVADADAAEEKRRRKEAKRAAAEEAVEVEEDPAEAKRRRKAAKRAAADAEAAAAETAGELEAEVEEAKRLRKLAKKALAAEDGAPATEEALAEEKKRKKLAKRAAAEAAAATAPPDEVEEDPAEAKRQRKLAKRAAAEAAAAAEEEAENDDADAKLLTRKEARKAAKAQAPEASDVVGGSTEEGTPAQPTAPGDDGDYTVFIRGLPFSVEEETVRKDFSDCGEIVNMNMPMNDQGLPRGIAFVKYKTKAGMEAALKFDGTDYGGRYLEVKGAWNGKSGDKGGKGDGKGKGKGEKGKGQGSMPANNSDFAVFLGSLPFSVDEDQLRTHFADCGEIASVRLPLRDDGKPKGIAFIRFTCDEAVEAAIKFNETELGGRNILARRATDNPKGGDGSGKDGKGKDGKGKDGKGKDGKGKGKGKGKKGKSGMSSEQFAARTGSMVESTGTKKTFDEDSDGDD